MNKVRLFRANSFYQDAIDRVYQGDPILSRQSYQAQYDRLMGSCFHWADFWKRHLEPLGQFEVCEAIWNAEIMQKAWARENGITFREEAWMEDILIAQVRRFQPHVFFPQGAGTLPTPFIKSVRQEFSGILVCGYDGVAHNDTARFVAMDIVFACLPGSVDFYRGQGSKSELFKLGFEDSINQRLASRPPLYESSFVGGLSLGKNGHRERLAFLSALAEVFPLQFHLRMPTDGAYLRSCVRYLLQGELQQAVVQPWRDLPKLHRLNRVNHGAVFGLEMFQVLRDSKTTLNFHIDAAGDSAANMRLFEATGVGTCLVTDWKPNISEFFEPDQEVVCFRTVEECLEKCTYLLGHGRERARIAANGQKRTVSQHRMRDSILTAGEVILRHVRHVQ